MLKVNLVISSGLLFAILLVFGCARILHPEGGAKDTTSPSVVYCSVENGSVNCKPKEIVVEYNKEIQIKNPKLIIITPFSEESDENFYNIEVWGNKLYIRFAKALKENTTYSISLSGAISDIREYTDAEDYTISFSTGPTLDSRKVSCRVLDKLSNLPCSRVQVLMYELLDGNDLPKDFCRPSYVAVTNQNGEAVFNNVREGRFFVCAVEGSYSMLESLGQIKSGFYSGSVDTADVDVIDALIFINYSDHTPLRVLSCQSFDNVFVINLNKEIAEYSLDIEDYTSDIYHKMSGDRKKIYIYASSPLIEKEVDVTIKDFAFNQILEKLTLRLDPGKTSTIASKFYVSVENGRSDMPHEGSIEIFSEKPFRPESFDYSLAKITIKEKDIYFSSSDITVLKDRIILKYHIDQDLFEENRDMEANFILEKSAILDIDYSPNTEQKVSLNIKNPKNCASIYGEIVNQDWAEIRLINQNGECMYVIYPWQSDMGKFSFIGVAPGKYLIKILKSSQIKSKWQTGNLYHGLSADDVFVYPEIIELYANWKKQGIVISF